MLTKALVLTDGEADLLSRVLEEVKTKAYEESETNLDDTQALDALVSWFRTTEKKEREKQRLHTYLRLYVSTLCWARLSIGKASRIPASTHKLGHNLLSKEKTSENNAFAKFCIIDMAVPASV